MTFDPENLKRELARLQKELNTEAGTQSTGQLPVILSGVAILIAVVALVVGLTRPGSVTEIVNPTGVSVQTTDESTPVSSEEITPTTTETPTETATLEPTIQTPEIVEINAQHDASADPLTWTFSIDQPPDTPVTYHWSLGDENSSTDSIVTHTYNQSGTYTVILTLGDENEAIVATGELTITVLPRLMVALSQETPDETNAPHQRSFSAQVQPSDVSGLTYAWNISDAQGTSLTDSSDARFDYDFELAGDYTISLTVTDPASGRSANDSEQITIQGPLEADFEFTITSPLTVQFTDKSKGSPEKYEWGFGDVSEPTAESDPTHPFPDFGTYTVTLSVQRGEERKMIEKEVTLTAPDISQARVQVQTSASGKTHSVPDSTPCSDTSQGDDTAQNSEPAVCGDIYALSHDFTANQILEVHYSVLDANSQPMVGLPFNISLTIGERVLASINANDEDLPKSSVNSVNRVEGKTTTDSNGQINLKIMFEMPLGQTLLADGANLPGEGFLELTSALPDSSLTRWLRIQPVVPEEYSVRLSNVGDIPLLKPVASVFAPGGSSQPVKDLVAYYRQRPPNVGSQTYEGVVYLWVNAGDLQAVDDLQTEADESLQPLDPGSVVEMKTLPLTYCGTMICLPPALEATWEGEKLTGRIIGHITDSEDKSFVLVEFSVNYN